MWSRTDFIKAFTPVVLGAFLLGCGSKDSFFALGTFERLSSCTSVLEETQKEVRIFFMVDASGSTDTTDPNYNYRAATIRTFLQRFGQKTNFTYAFGYFMGTSSRLYNGTQFATSVSATANIGDAAFLTEAIDEFVSINSTGNTPYQAAFNKLEALVAADVAANGSRYSYAVVFMSDGEPTDVPSPVETNLKNLVTDLQNHVPGTALTVGTVYFGPTTQSDYMANLKTISSTGKGQFVDTNKVDNLTISDIITIPGRECAGPSTP